MTGDLSGGLVAAGQLTTFRCDFVLIQVDQVDYSQLVTHGDGVSGVDCYRTYTRPRTYTSCSVLNNKSNSFLTVLLLNCSEGWPMRMPCV